MRTPYPRPHRHRTATKPVPSSPCSARAAARTSGSSRSATTLQPGCRPRVRRLLRQPVPALHPAAGRDRARPSQHEAEVADQIDVDRRARRCRRPQLPDETLLLHAAKPLLPERHDGGARPEIVEGSRPGYPQAERIADWIRENIDYPLRRERVQHQRAGHAEAGRRRLPRFRARGHGAVPQPDDAGPRVVGYLHELDPMDMHAWYEVYLGDRWFPFDATQDAARAAAWWSRMAATPPTWPSSPTTGRWRSPRWT